MPKSVQERRDILIAAMNPPGGGGWSSEAQELNLLLHDQAAAMPEGWRMQYAVSDDDSERSPNNREIFASEQRARQHINLTERYAATGDDDDLADREEIPSDGHHVLIVLKHAESGTEVRRWADRESLMTTVRDKNHTPAQKLAVVRAHVDEAMQYGSVRVDRKWRWIVREIEADPSGKVAQRWADRLGMKAELREAQRAAAVDDADDEAKAAPGLVVERLVAAVESRRQAGLNVAGTGQRER